MEEWSMGRDEQRGGGGGVEVEVRGVVMNVIVFRGDDACRVTNWSYPSMTSVIEGGCRDTAVRSMSGIYDDIYL